MPTKSISTARTSSTLIARLIETPDLVRRVRALPPPAFSALVRRIGVEDAGEIIALATSEQLIAAFDEDLFVNQAPGERETFDAARFAVWLEVMLEAGEAATAARIAELSEDFVAQALSSLLLVLDHDALLASMNAAGEDAARVDKAMESCQSEEIDGYLLISRNHEGWDAALALVVALDRDQRALLVRVLDRCTAVTSDYVDDLQELASVLSAEESLAEDVEAEREQRRARQGYVEPRAARGFLRLARQPLPAQGGALERDALTKAYFRDLEPVARYARSAKRESPSSRTEQLRGAVASADSAGLFALAGDVRDSSSASEADPFACAMRLLGEEEPQAFAERLEELAYLGNVLAVGAGNERVRLTPGEAAEAALATVCLGAILEVIREGRTQRPVGAEDLRDILVKTQADLLFRRASSTLSAAGFGAGTPGFLRSRTDISVAESALRAERGPRR